MNNFVTIHKFTYIHELFVLRSLLDVNDIEYQILDELTAQTIPYISNAYGGIRLQVREKDAERALELLIEKGFIEEEKEEAPSKFYIFIDDFTMKIPGLNKLKWEARVLIIASIITLCLLHNSNINKILYFYVCKDEKILPQNYFMS